MLVDESHHKVFPISDYFLQLKDIRRWKWACPEFCSASPTSFYWLLLWWVTRGRVCRMGGTKSRPVQSPVWRSVRSTRRVCAHFIVVLQTHSWFKTSQDQFIKVHYSVQLGLNGFVVCPGYECLYLCPDSCCSETDVQDLSGSVDNSLWDKCGRLSPL